MLMLLGGLCAAVLSLTALFLYLDPQVPKAETYRQVKLETPLRVYAEDGALLAEFGERRLIPVQLQQVPEHFINALLNTEDKRFYEHSGIDFISLANDTIGLIGTFITEGELGPGASTITMQLARNVSFSLERRFLRKFKEMLLALKVERELTKDEILELYINIVPFGKRAYGAEAAARTYYGKSLKELTLPQLAMLAGIPQAPTAGNPINGPERAFKRRNLVLSRMRAQDSIDDETYDAAITAPITASVFNRELDLASPYPAEWVRQLAVNSYSDLYTGGYEIFTTLYSDLQASAITALRKGLLSYDRRHGYRGPEGTLAEDLVFQLTNLQELVVETSDPTETLTDSLELSLEPSAEPSADAITEASPLPSELSETIVAALEDIATYGELIPAVVIKMDAESATTINKKGNITTLQFTDTGWARPYLGVDLRGPSHDQFSDFLNLGDIVRVQHRDEVWKLAQLPEIQGALISMDPSNGKVRAIVGGFDFYRNQYNHALQAARQPGSGFKPFVYSAALRAGVTPADIFMDAPLVFDDVNLESQYRPDNDNNSYNGPTRLREALYRSINLVSMRVLLKVGAGQVMEHAADLGFVTNRFPRNTQLAIGGGTMAITPSDMARAYSILANGGYLIEPHIIDFIVDGDGEEIFRSNRPLVCATCLEDLDGSGSPEEEPSFLAQMLVESTNDELSTPQKDALSKASTDLTIDLREAITATELAEPALEATSNPSLEQATEPELIPQIYAQRVLDERNAFIMNSMLRDVIQKGTGQRARSLGRRDIAGKTGTTNEAADTWFNGFHANLATSVWVGFSNHEALGAREYGSNTPLPIWIDYMRTALPKLPVHNLSQPSGVVSLKIDPKSGLPAAPNQPGAMFEYFLSEHAPKARQDEESLPVDTEEVNAIDLF